MLLILGKHSGGMFCISLCKLRWQDIIPMNQIYLSTAPKPIIGFRWKRWKSSKHMGHPNGKKKLKNSLLRQES